MLFKTYESWEEMQADMQDNQKAADQMVKPHQAALKSGDFFVRLLLGIELIVYGEVLDPTKPAHADHVYSAEELDEIVQEAEIYKQPHMRNYRWSRCYSVDCPEGELGDTHVCTVHCALTKEQFDLAQELRWPKDPEILGGILSGELKPQPRN